MTLSTTLCLHSVQYPWKTILYSGRRQATKFILELTLLKILWYLQSPKPTVPLPPPLKLSPPQELLLKLSPVQCYHHHPSSYCSSYPRAVTAKVITTTPAVTAQVILRAVAAQVITTTPAVTAQVIPRAVTAQVITTTPAVTAQVIPSSYPLKLSSPQQSPLKLSPPPQQSHHHVTAQVITTSSAGPRRWSVSTWQPPLWKYFKIKEKRLKEYYFSLLLKLFDLIYRMIIMFIAVYLISCCWNAGEYMHATT